MTLQKPRHPMTFAGAMAEIIRGLGIDVAAATVRLAPSTVYAWADPDQKHGPSLAHALALDTAYVRAGHGEPPLRAVYTAKLAEIENATPAEDPLVRVAAAAADLGRVADDLRAQPRAGRLSEAEKARAAADVARLISDATALLADLAPAGDAKMVRVA